jgi:hypothetical protein
MWNPCATTISTTACTALSPPACAVISEARTWTASDGETFRVDVKGSTAVSFVLATIESFRAEVGAVCFAAAHAVKITATKHKRASEILLLNVLIEPINY